MAISNFIPTIWSETLLTSLDKQYIAVSNCNRDFEGEIKNKGSVVKICGVGDISINDYTKNTDMSSPQALSDTMRELTIDQAKFFNFQIDDVDKVQCAPKLMEAAMHGAANAIANEVDKYIYSLYNSADTVLYHNDLNDGQLIDTIIKARQKLYENNVTDSSSIVLEVSPTVAYVILKEKLAVTSSNDTLENGCIGSIAGCKIFVSNNVDVTVGDEGKFHNCIMRTKRAVSYAEQLSEIDAYRPEKRFADAVKGLLLFGARAVYPQEMVAIRCYAPL